MGLFSGGSSDPSYEAWKQAGYDRLLALSPEALALEALNAMQSIEQQRGVVTMQVIDIENQMMGGEVRGWFTIDPLGDPLNAALRRLEHANLVVNNGFWRISQEGHQALADGATAQKLGLAGANLETILSAVGQPAAVRLQQLDALRYQRLVSDEEFEAAKAKILTTP